ncbi:MAG: hypothetical protein AAFO95_01465 [Cyanobacteria bacterium J06600_6]
MNNQQSTINWTIPRVLAAALGVGWVTVQIVVPLFWLVERGFSPKPRQFGWQMYTNMAGGDRFFVVKNDLAAEIDLDDFAHNVRPGLDYGDIFLAYLCQQFPEAKQTQRLKPNENQPQVYQCNSIKNRS